MTYMQLIIKTLKFIKETGLTIHLMVPNDKDILKTNAKYGLMYLTIYNLLLNDSLPEEQRKYLQRLFEYLDNVLSYDGKDLGAAISNHMSSTYEKALSDPYYQDQLLSIISSEDTTQEDIDSFLTQISDEMREYNPEDYTVYYRAMYPIEDIIWDVRNALPLLFFSKEGYKYIDKEYQIEDNELRRRVFHFVRESIEYFEESIDSHIYHDEEDNNDEDILYKSIDEDRKLYVSVSLIFYILKLVKNNELDKIRRLLELDDSILSVIYYSSNGKLNIRPIFSFFYDPKKITNFDEIIKNNENDYLLDFFLDNNSPTKKLSMHDVALLIILYGKDKKIDQLVIKDWNNVLNILKRFYQNYLVKLLKNKEKDKSSTRLECICNRFCSMKRVLRQYKQRKIDR